MDLRSTCIGRQLLSHCELKVLPGRKQAEDRWFLGKDLLPRETKTGLGGGKGQVDGRKRVPELGRPFSVCFKASSLLPRTVLGHVTVRCPVVPGTTALVQPAWESHLGQFPLLLA